VTLRTTGACDTQNSVDDETPISPTELRALRRLAEPEAPSTVAANELWASRYRIIEAIGRGGMGDVFLARDVLLDRQVALKVLRNSVDDDLVDERLLLREARAAARAEHPRIARVYDAGTWNDRAFIAMEYVRGETLREWLKTHRATPEEVVFILQQLVEGIQALHERELVHRDLKPENVMVAHDGNLRILDLGIARRVPLGVPQQSASDWSSQSIGFGVGTPGYMAPEQWQGIAVDARADVFALGVILYELVLGSAPFRATNNPDIRNKTLSAELSFEQPEWSAMPPGLRDVTRQALSRDRELRFASVGQMLAPLLPLLRPSIPPISSARAPSFRPSAAQAFAVDSAQASALGVSIRALPNARSFLRNRYLWAVAGTLAVSALIGGALRQRNAARSSIPPTPGMVRLRGGSFSTGTDAEDLAITCKTLPKGCPPEAQNEIPRRAATILPFELDEHEVTNEDFVTFLNATAPSLSVAQDPDDHYDRFVNYFFRSNDALLIYDLWSGTAGIRYTEANREGFSARPQFEKLPVVQVSWLGARLFCKNAGKRLPTESEWEFAAGGSERRPYPWGGTPPACEGVHIASKGWISLIDPDRCDNVRETPFPVMTAGQDSTPEGVKDLAGNVAEWVDADDGANIDDAAYEKRLMSETPAIFKGGAFNTNFMARSAARNYRLAFNVADDLGFRCARSIRTPTERGRE
jgi:serine/threonine protein kinase